eukprot:TRINITY_DN19327_c0_g1_i1.p1 TRINITY_DN19327_c0_g1~~TRINITY_DN19327_c0_g1_i1.p1  ORF type:complete len:268 (+),score=87.95 TRINITY_DN19327_c0_g1_i1:134-937(+)
MYQVAVTVQNARNLVASDAGTHHRTSDPYCKIYWGSNQVSTSVKRKTVDPYWNESFNLTSSSLDDISVYVYDKDRFTKDDLIGQGKVTTNDLQNGMEITKTVSLMPRGEVILRLRASGFPQMGYGAPQMGGYGAQPMGGYGQPAYGAPPMGAYPQQPMAGYGQPAYGAPPMAAYPPQPAYTAPPPQMGYGAPPQMGGYPAQQPYGQPMFNQPMGMGMSASYAPAGGAAAPNLSAGYGAPVGGLAPGGGMGGPAPGGLAPGGGYPGYY